MVGSLLSIPVAFGLSLVGWRRDEGRAYAAAGMAVSGLTAIVAFFSIAALLALNLCD
jgi:hypothetical protein